jgi:bifunctional non-homologous end joining protein LigD
VQKANHDAPVAYYVFDLLWVNGYSTMQLTLIDRKRILKSMISSQGVLKFSDHFNDGIALYEQAQELLLEGIIAKKENSIYQPDKRGANWLKIPIAR